MNLKSVFGITGQTPAPTRTAGRTDTRQPPGHGTSALSNAGRWMRNLALQASDTLDHSGLQQRALSQLTAWGLSQAQAEAIVAAPGYALAHAQAFGGEPPTVRVQGWLAQGLSFEAMPGDFSPGDQERCRTLCLAWLGAGPAGAACQLLDAVLPQLPQAAHSLLGAHVNTLMEGTQAGQCSHIVEAIVALAERGWSTANSPNFMPEDLRGPLTALASKFDPAAGLRVALASFRQTEQALTLDALAAQDHQLAQQLMQQLEGFWATAQALGSTELGGSTVQLAQSLARRCPGAQALQDRALALARQRQQARTQNALAALAPWCSITVDDSGQGLVGVEVRADDPALDSSAKRKAAASVLREYLRAQVDGPDGLSWAALEQLVQSIATATPSQHWLDTDHWTQLACSEASRSGELKPLRRILLLADPGTVSPQQLQRAIRRVAAAPEQPGLQQELMAKLAALLPARDAQSMAVHRAWWRQWTELTHSDPRRGRALWDNYSQQHPWAPPSGLGQLASAVMDALAAKGLQGGGRTRAKTRRALADGLVQCLLQSFSEPGDVAQRTQQLQQRFSLLRLATSQQAPAQRGQTLQRLQAEGVQALSDAHAAKAEVPLALAALQGGVIALLQTEQRVQPPAYDEKLFANPEVDFFRGWSQVLMLQAQDKPLEAWHALSELRSDYRVRSMQQYSFSSEPADVAEHIFKGLSRQAPTGPKAQASETGA